MVHATTLGLRFLVFRPAFRFCFNDLLTTVFSNPSLDTVWVFCDLEDSCSVSHWERWPVTAKTSLTSICQIDSIVVAVVIVTVLVTCNDPFNCFLFNQCREKTSVYRGATDGLIMMTVELVIIDEVNVFY